jgi:hypothetical protein
MLNELLIWVALLGGVVFLTADKRRGSGALTLAYFLTLSLGHIPGLLAYLDPNLESEAVKVGADVTLIGMTAFIVGALAARVLPQPITSVKAHRQAFSDDIDSRVGWRVLAIGVVAHFVLLPVSALLPSLTVIIASGGSFLVLGFWLLLYSSTIHRESRQTLQILMMLPLLPLSTLVIGGFLSFGTAWVLSIVAFHFVIVRRRIWFYLATPPVIFLGLSLFVTYFQQRDDIRDVVWYQKAGITQRLNQVTKLATEFQLLDLSNEKHRWSLDERLNQNFLVGLGVIRHRQDWVELSYGATIPIWALVPRAIWPDKPAVGGSGELVAEFTGISFAEGTSVGVGQVLEFYMNFGTTGVVAGFAILGFILMRLDQAITRALATVNMHALVQTALPGLALLQPMGSLLEMLVATVSAIIVARLAVHSKFLVPSFAPRQNTKISGQTRRTAVQG